MLPPNTVFVAPPSMSSLAQSIAHALRGELIIPEFIRFSDGEIEVRLPHPTSITGKPVCIIQSTYPPVDETIMQLIVLAHELSNAGAVSITALIPYFGYARHDASKIPGGKGSVMVIVKLLQAAGINTIITVDIHNPAIIPSLVLPMHSISLTPFIAEHIKHMLPSLAGVCLVAPDHGALSRVQDIARIVGVGYISFTKERYAPDTIKLVSSQGSCRGATAIIIDDMIDTGDTALNVCHALRQKGYTSIYGYFMHPVLSGDAVNRIMASDFNQIFVSNSIPLNNCVPKIKIFDIAKVVCELLLK